MPGFYEAWRESENRGVPWKEPHPRRTYANHCERALTVCQAERQAAYQPVEKRIFRKIGRIQIAGYVLPFKRTVGAIFPYMETSSEMDNEKASKSDAFG